MIIMRSEGSFCNQLSVAMLGYMIAREKDTELVMDTSGCYNSYFDFYSLGYVDFPCNSVIMYRFKKNDWSTEVIMDERYRAIMGGQDVIRINNEAELNDALSIKQDKNHYHLSGSFPDYMGYHQKRPELLQKYFDRFKRMFQPFVNRRIIREFVNAKKGDVYIGMHLRKRGIQHHRENLFIKDDEEDRYFKAAIVYYRERYPHAKFYIFTDQMAYVRQVLGNGNDLYYVRTTGGVMGDIEELLLLSLCDHRILSTHSGFSWFSSYFCENEDKLDAIQENEHPDWKAWFQYQSILMNKGMGHPPLFQVFDQEKVDDYISRYQDLEPREQNDVQGLKCELSRQVENGRIGEAYHTLSRLSLDAYGLSDQDLVDMNWSLVRLQYGEQLFGECEHTLQRLEELGCRDKALDQWYAKIYDKMGRKTESHLYGEAYRQPGEGKKHFIIFPLTKYHKEMHRDLTRVSTWLARLGHRVSFVARKGKDADYDDYEEGSVAEWLIRHSEECITAYDFDCGFRVYNYKELNQVENLKQFIHYMRMMYGEEIVVLSRKPCTYLIKEDFPDVKHVYLDIDGEVDDEYKASLSALNDSDKETMCERADAVITTPSRLNEPYLQECKQKTYLYDNGHKYLTHVFRHGVDSYSEVRRRIAEENIEVVRVIQRAVEEMKEDSVDSGNCC